VRRPHGRPRPTSTNGQAGQARLSGLAWRSKAVAQVRQQRMPDVRNVGALGQLCGASSVEQGFWVWVGGPGKMWKP
jgi:hypothetical protein